MSDPKFDELDRDKVIEWLENHLEVKLTPISNKKKYLRDQEGKRYCLIGAREDCQHWHGIEKEIIENANDWIDGDLIIAIRYKEHINIYQGPIKPLIQNKNYLKPSVDGYQFHTKEKENSLTIIEVPSLSLGKIGEMDSTSYLRELMKEVKDNPKLLAKIKKLIGEH